MLLLDNTNNRASDSDSIKEPSKKQSGGSVNIEGAAKELDEIVLKARAAAARHTARKQEALRQAMPGISLRPSYDQSEDADDSADDGVYQSQNAGREIDPEVSYPSQNAGLEIEPETDDYPSMNAGKSIPSDQEDLDRPRGGNDPRDDEEFQKHQKSKVDKEEKKKDEQKDSEKEPTEESPVDKAKTAAQKRDKISDSKQTQNNKTATNKPKQKKTDVKKSKTGGADSIKSKKSKDPVEKAKSTKQAEKKQKAEKDSKKSKPKSEKSSKSGGQGKKKKVVDRMIGKVTGGRDPRQKIANVLEEKIKAGTGIGTILWIVWEALTLGTLFPTLGLAGLPFLNLLLVKPKWNYRITVWILWLVGAGEILSVVNKLGIDNVEIKIPGWQKAMIIVTDMLIFVLLIMFLGAIVTIAGWYLCGESILSTSTLAQGATYVYDKVYGTNFLEVYKGVCEFVPKTQ